MFLDDHDFPQIAPIAGRGGAEGADFEVDFFAALEVVEDDFAGVGGGIERGVIATGGVGEGALIHGGLADGID